MRNSFKKISVLLLTLILVIGTTGFPDIAEAKVKVGVPQMKKWYKSYDSLKSPNPVGNGVQYTLKWKKVKGATGYTVCYKTKAKGSWKKLKTTKGASFTKKKLKSGKTYYFTVKAYKTYKKKTYTSSFSGKKVVIK